MRTFVIGDIHGSYLALKQVIERSGFNPEVDRIICVGDYVDGWSQSYEVVEYLIELQKKCNGRNIYILGNHDDWFRDVLEKRHAFAEIDFIRANFIHWWSQGGAATYKSYAKQTGPDLTRHYREFYSKLVPYHLEEDDEVLYVHAGFFYRMGFKETLKLKPFELWWDRSLYERAKHLWHLEQRGAELRTETRRLGDFDRIYIGHTTTVSDDIFEPVEMCNVVNLDQGCGYYGKLTIWEHGTDKYWQSDRCLDLYPNETGR